MKKIFLLLALLWSMCGLNAAETPDAVRVTPATGDPIVILFSANPEVTYTSTGATITASGQDAVTLDFDDIAFIDFVTYGSVSGVEGAQVSLRVTQDAIVIDNAEAGSQLAVYTLDGRQVVSATIPESYSIERSSLAKGAYIIRINKTSFKILL